MILPVNSRVVDSPTVSTPVRSRAPKSGEFSRRHFARMRKLHVFHHANPWLLVDDALREMLAAQPFVTIRAPVLAQFAPDNLANPVHRFPAGETLNQHTL